MRVRGRLVLKFLLYLIDPDGLSREFGLPPLLILLREGIL